MTKLNDLSLNDIAPSSIKDDKNISAIIEALNPDLKFITQNISKEFIYSRIDELDSGVLDLLAWQFHVDFYDLTKDLDAKRRQVKDSIQWHMKKGTAWAVLKALDMIGIEAEFINWYEFGGAPYTFKIKADIPLDYHKYTDKDKIIHNIIRAINESKAARSFLAYLDAHLNDFDKKILFAGIAHGTSGQALINISRPEAPGNNINYLGLAQGISGYERININRPSVDETKIYMALAENKNRNISLGVDLNTMNELLAQFEARIFDRLAQHEARIMTEINARQNEINAKIDEILDLLRWEDAATRLQ
ncbi:MAG: phage tail protein I [Synergistaceae bacterium]|nr:phage tail protein I [Synergistaceae bacterium]